MESLPSDIVLEILSRVPAESVLECKLVCKKWVTLIRRSNFANMHLSRLLNHLHVGDDGNDNLAAKVESSLIFACLIYDPDDVTTLLFLGGQISQKCIYNENLKRIYHPPMHDEPIYDHLVGSCNGLVCAFQLHDTILDPIYICNPLIREYVYLPQLVVEEEDSELIEGGEIDMCGLVACGFGYLGSTNEYKVVRIHYLNDESAEGNVEVYTLGSGCGWRAIGKVSYRLDIISRGTYVNDAIYWISGKKVVSFDLADEEFRLLSVPPWMQNCPNSCSCGLVSLGRHLCFYRDISANSSVRIWSLTKSSDSKETWRAEFDINYEDIVGFRGRIFQPICLTKNGEIIFLFARSALYSYDPKATMLKMISNEALTENFNAVKVIAHVNTFASLETMGESSKRYTVRPRRARTPWDDVIDELDGVALGEVIDTTRFRLRDGKLEGERYREFDSCSFATSNDEDSSTIRHNTTSFTYW